jgi:hypothetical protein
MKIVEIKSIYDFSLKFSMFSWLKSFKGQRLRLKF